MLNDGSLLTFSLRVRLSDLGATIVGGRVFAPSGEELTCVTADDVAGLPAEERAARNRAWDEAVADDLRREAALVGIDETTYERDEDRAQLRLTDDELQPGDGESGVDHRERLKAALVDEGICAPVARRVAFASWHVRRHTMPADRYNPVAGRTPHARRKPTCRPAARRPGGRRRSAASRDGPDEPGEPEPPGDVAGRRSDDINDRRAP